MAMHLALQGSNARREVSELVSQLQLAAELLPLPEDRLLTFVEGAQVSCCLPPCCCQRCC